LVFALLVKAVEVVGHLSLVLVLESLLVVGAFLAWLHLKDSLVDITFNKVLLFPFLQLQVLIVLGNTSFSLRTSLTTIAACGNDLATSIVKCSSLLRILAAK